ncbi:hypothetical protein CapIbe_022057 [Capra ibex]
MEIALGEEQSTGSNLQQDLKEESIQVLSQRCLRTSLEVHVGIIPGVQVGTRTGFERHKDSSRMENM